MGFYERRVGTFYLTFVNKNNNTVSFPFIQFSLKTPWFIPHREVWLHDNGGHTWICGWLFFYFGKMVYVKER